MFKPKSLVKLYRLPRQDLFLLIRAYGLVAGIRVGLTLFRFNALRDRFVPPVSTTCDEDRRPRRERLVWAVQVASRGVPRATCLTQALAVQSLFHRHGYPAELRIGVAKAESGDLDAHAWVECDGRIVIGGGFGPRYTPFEGL